MSERPKLLNTRNYTIFENHEYNRPLHGDPVLLDSMRRHGFLASSPIHVKHNGNGKLKIVRGHNRFDCAKRLGLPVHYIIDDTKVDIFELEGSPRQAWNGPDYLYARAHAGNADCARLLEFQKQHGLTLGAAASLLGGESAGSGNMIKTIKSGKFKIAADTSHAIAVVSLTDYCRELGVEFATSSAFVSAVSMCLRVPEFDMEIFRRRLKAHGLTMKRCGRQQEYLDEIERLYNHASKSTRLPLAFMARDLSKARHDAFGRDQRSK